MSISHISKNLSVRSVFAVVATLMLALPATTRGDEKSLPATACNWHWEEFLGSSADRPLFTGYGGVTNTDSSAFQAFSCPIVRDDVGGGDGKLSSLKVSVYDGNANYQIQCRLYHNDGDSSNYVYGNADGSTAGYDTLTPSIPATWYYEGLYNIYCTVPPHSAGQSASSLRSYWWNE